MKRVHVEAGGEVQGVSFRDSCRREAERHGVSGWVRNAEAGTVEAELEGDDADVDALVEWFRTGPPHAAVRHVDVSDLEPTGAAGFEVR